MPTLPYQGHRTWQALWGVTDEVISLDTNTAHTCPRHDFTEWCFIGGGIATTGSLGLLPRSSRAYSTVENASDWQSLHRDLLAALLRSCGCCILMPDSCS